MARTLDKTVNDRQHLSGREFERLLEAVKGSRNEIRDRCLFLLMFRHGLRASEACGLVLEQVDIESRILHVARLKGGLTVLEDVPALIHLINPMLFVADSP
jgi:integrase